MDYKTWIETDYIKCWDGSKLHIKDLSLSQCKHLMKLIRYNDFKCLLAYHIQILEFGESNLNPNFSTRKYMCNKSNNCQESGELSIVADVLMGVKCDRKTVYSNKRR